MEARLDYIVQLRHGVIHKLELDSGLTKQQIVDILDTALAIIDTFVDYLEGERGKLIRDEALQAGVTAAAPSVSAQPSGQRPKKTDELTPKRSESNRAQGRA